MKKRLKKPYLKPDPREGLNMAKLCTSCKLHCKQKRGEVVNCPKYTQEVNKQCKTFISR